MMRCSLTRLATAIMARGSTGHPRAHRLGHRGARVALGHFGLQARELLGYRAVLRDGHILGGVGAVGAGAQGAGGGALGPAHAGPEAVLARLDGGDPAGGGHRARLLLGGEALVVVVDGQVGAVASEGGGDRLGIEAIGAAPVTRRKGARRNEMHPFRRAARIVGGEVVHGKGGNASQQRGRAGLVRCSGRGVGVVARHGRALSPARAGRAM
nr:hypothetical protein [Elioraea thermophila]